MPGHDRRVALASQITRLQLDLHGVSERTLAEWLGVSKTRTHAMLDADDAVTIRLDELLRLADRNDDEGPAIAFGVLSQALLYVANARPDLLREPVRRIVASLATLLDVEPDNDG